jgi:hypothetical protein
LFGTSGFNGGNPVLFPPGISAGGRVGAEGNPVLFPPGISGGGKDGAAGNPVLFPPGISAGGREGAAGNPVLFPPGISAGGSVGADGNPVLFPPGIGIGNPGCWSEAVSLFPPPPPGAPGIPSGGVTPGIVGSVELPAIENKLDYSSSISNNRVQNMYNFTDLVEWVQEWKVGMDLSIQGIQGE